MKNVKITAVSKNGNERALSGDEVFDVIDIMENAETGRLLFSYCKKHRGLVKGKNLNKAGNLEKGNFKEGSFYTVNKIEFANMEMFSITSQDQNYSHVVVVAISNEMMNYNKIIDINETEYSNAFSENELKEGVFFDGNDHYLKLVNGKISILEKK